MKLYVIRHGRTNANEKGIFNGRNDEDINETGIKQAEEVREKLKEKEIDLIISSPMKRAKHTANIINTKNIPIIYDERLIERDTGEFTLKPANTIDREEYWNYYSSKYKNVESVPHLFKRVNDFLNEIKEKYSNKNILIVTHNGVSRAIYAYFNGIPKDGKLLKIGTHDNCQIREYKI